MTSFFRRFLLLCCAPPLVAASEIQQSGKAGCTVNIAEVRGNVGSVTLNCPSLSPEALRKLNELLRTIKGREAKLQAADTWAQKYHDLEATLAALGRSGVEDMG